MILIRHGQTIFNVIFSVTRIDPGVPDPLLTSRGRGQARDIAASLAGEDIGRVVASPYRRAIQTADTVARSLGVPLTIDPDVRERFSFSCDVGTRTSELARTWPEYDFTSSRRALVAGVGGKRGVVREALRPLPPAHGGRPRRRADRRHHPLGRDPRADGRTRNQRHPRAARAGPALTLYARTSPC